MELSWSALSFPEVSCIGEVALIELIDVSFAVESAFFESDEELQDAVKMINMLDKRK